MQLIRNGSVDPYFNLAAEEYLLDSMDDTTVMLWRNDKTVVVGYNQNAYEEVNADYVAANGIGVVRRLTGGGAVFHDLGNVNFTFIQPFKDELFNDYSFFTAPVRDFLRTLGVEAELSGRNDLLIDGMKFSGNAQTRRNGRIMHHGTLLFSASVADISGALKPNKLKIEGKGIKSVRSRVTNISSHLGAPMGVEEFQDRLYAYFRDRLDGVAARDLSGADKAAIEALVDRKYGTRDWNWGRAADYGARRERKFDFGLVDLRLSVEGGRIASMKVYGDFFGTADVAELEKRFQGVPHEKGACAAVLSACDPGAYISGMAAADFLDLIVS